jgi:VanZ family protein
MKIRIFTLIYVLYLTATIAAADQGKLIRVYSLVGKVPAGDKIGHFILMGTLAWLINASLGWRKTSLLGRAVLLGSAIVFAASTIEECSQRLFPARTFELLDLAGDYAGIMVAGLLAPRAGALSRSVVKKLRACRGPG